jgi:glycosyltransferase involved in cell wall biosynthesis
VRILELGKFYSPYRGGMETLLQIWSEGFVQRGAEVDCVVASDCARSTHETLNGVRVHRLASYGSLASVSLCPAYPGAARRHAADVWHLHSPNPLADLAVLRGARDVPLVVSYHSDVIRQRGLMAFYRPLFLRMLRRASVIVVGTPLHIEHSPWLPAFRDKCEVVPFGLDLSRFKITPELETAAAQLRAPLTHKAAILTIGRLVEYKGIRYLIEAMRDVDATLWIAGTGPLEAELKQLARELGVTGRVQFPGAVAEEQLPALFHACDVFVLPSVTPNEAFGLVQVEAMACGKPVVSCALKSGVPWVNQNGVTGLVVPPADAPALAVALKRLLADDALRAQLGGAGRERAAREFDQRVMLDRYWRLLQRLAARRTGSDDV